MILSDIKGGLYSVSSTVMFLNGTIEIESFISNSGKGYNIDYKELGVIIRVYKNCLLSYKELCMFTDNEIKGFAEELLRYSIYKCSLSQITEWIIHTKNTSFECGIQETKNNIRKALGV